MEKSKTALLIIDYQVIDFNRNETLYKSEDFKNNIKSLVTNARKKNIPIFLTKHNGKLGSPSQKGSAGWSIHPSLELKGDEIIIEKNYPDSFQQTNLEAQLMLRNINHLVIAGLETEICVDSTCRQAYSKGFAVTIVKDGHSTYDSQNIAAQQIIMHHNKVFKDWFANVMDTNQIEF
ncbi:cysteine hydrolase family protein [Niallia taxi]|uniref:cysteine hydrolase family protein n=1 Tax=Niallia taxi TaxID=2499688 RepID=UPI00119D714D